MAHGNLRRPAHRATGGPPSAPPPLRPRNSKFLLYTIPALFLAAFAGLAFWRVETRLHVRAALVPAAAEANEVSVAVVHPRRADASQNLILPGNVQAYVETPIYARTDGYLKRWYVDIGGRVKAGELLATIETPEVDQQLHQAEAAQLQAQANLDLAKTTADRWRALLKSDGVSQQEVDQNESAYKARQADLNAAAANVERLKYMQSFPAGHRAVCRRDHCPGCRYRSADQQRQFEAVVPPGANRHSARVRKRSGSRTATTFGWAWRPICTLRNFRTAHLRAKSRTRRARLILLPVLFSSKFRCRILMASSCRALMRRWSFILKLEARR